jgi:CysZ protein
VRFFEQVFLSFKYYGETIRFIDQHNLYRKLILPSVLSLLVAVFVAWFGWKTSEDIISNLLSVFSFRTLTGFWGDMIELVFRFVVRLITLFIYLKVYRYLLLLVLAPSFMVISQKVQSIALNEPPDFSGKAIVKNILRSMEIAILNFFRDMLLSGLIILIAIVVTWLAPVAPFAIFFAESYFFGYAMIDYRNQFLHKSIKESKNIIHNNMGLTIGNGICFNLILLIPVFGIMVGPSLALIAGGISIDEVEKLKNDYAIRKSI